jgi:protein-tyrosine phosphatase
MSASTAPGRPLRVLFVCTGNICRSPLAEAVFKRLVAARGLAAHYEVDSAGTHGWHCGELADPRTRRVGDLHATPVESVARELCADDCERFDVLVAMDRGHLRELQARFPPALHSRLVLMRDYDAPGSSKDVPDPYYGSFKGFEEVYTILERCCRKLLDALEAARRTPATEAAPGERA